MTASMHCKAMQFKEQTQSARIHEVKDFNS